MFLVFVNDSRNTEFAMPVGPFPTYAHAKAYTNTVDHRAYHEPAFPFRVRTIEPIIAPNDILGYEI